ncbi:NYN domain-containing protein [Lentinula edodes]|uniref:NYN domain-containing protein n=1 Tax=Lentinula edodes TaxID=5353 RepID=UPI001E8E5DB7|nr:NYN domain-containing protein [Lentinula edodes]KAH7877683.1 NYN domain-containing protein [Lentinula edodes]
MRTGSSAGHNGQVAIFWDYDNCSPPPNISGYVLVSRIRDLAHEYGSVNLFKAYTHISEQTSTRSLALRSELQSSGISLTDCPRNDRKDTVDQMIIADVLTFAMDNPYPTTTTIMLISGERDFAYTLSILRLRMYRVVVVAPGLPGSQINLEAQASFFFDWYTIINGQQKGEKKNTILPSRPMESSTSTESVRPRPHTASTYFAKPPERHETFQSCSNLFEPKNAPACAPFRRLTSEVPSSITQTPVPATMVEKPANRFPILLNEDSPDIALIPLSQPSPIIATDADSQKTIFSESEDTASFPASQSGEPINSSMAAVGSEINRSLARKQGPTASRGFLGRTATPEVPEAYQRLIHLLEDYRLRGDQRPFRSAIALGLITQDPFIYQKAGFPKFGPFVTHAAELGLVKLGGTGGTAWISLHYSLHGKIM